MNNINIAQNIKTLCKINNVPISKLLDNCNLHKNFIYYMEKKNVSPTIDNLYKISSFLKVDIIYLFNSDIDLIDTFKKYNQLDDLGKQKIKNVINEENKRIEEIKKYENMEIRYLAIKPKDPNSLGEKPNLTAEEVLRLKKYLLKLDE